MLVVRTIVTDLSNTVSLAGVSRLAAIEAVFGSAAGRPELGGRPAIGGFLPFARFRSTMTRIPASGDRGNVPFWTTVAVAALYLPASITARALVDPAYAAGRRGVPRAVADAAGALPAVLVGAALWLVVAGGFLYAFATELDAMRTQTPWSPPAKGYLILAAGSLLAHPVAGVPLLFLLVPGYTLHRGLRVR